LHSFFYLAFFTCPPLHIFSCHYKLFKDILLSTDLWLETSPGAQTHMQSVRS
jgi:hypothetical protein